MGFGHPYGHPYLIVNDVSSDSVSLFFGDTGFYWVIWYIFRHPLHKLRVIYTRVNSMRDRYMIVDTTHGSVTMLVDANSRDIVVETITVEDSILLFNEAMANAKKHDAMVNAFKNQSFFRKLLTVFKL